MVNVVGGMDDEVSNLINGKNQQLTLEIFFSHENHREARIIQQTNYVPHNTFQPPPPNKYIPTSNYYFSNRVDNADNIELVGNSKPPAADSYAKPQLNVQNLQSFTPIRQSNYQSNNINPSPREVSETDLVLLSAIEKLTYRVDFLEQRLRKAEQLILYLADGGNPNREPGNFFNTPLEPSPFPNNFIIF